MKFPERFSDLPEYAFPRLRNLLDAKAPGGDVVHMSIGEPRHPFPHWVAELISQNIEGFGSYPPNEGTPELLQAIAAWLLSRFGAVVSPDNQIMALNGTREGLFNACVALCPEKTSNGGKPVILVPNPFYQVYAVAGAAVGAEVVFVPATQATGFLPDFASVGEDILARTEVVYICTPSNPQGAVATKEYLADLIALAERHDFKIFSDECYSEIYRDEPPVSSLQVAADVQADPNRVVIFHSLSKRSNLPGLRSGFVAGGADSIDRIKTLRAYAGAPLPLPLQRVAEKVWGDENHVRSNRALYQQKFQAADQVFAGVPGYTSPQAGFFLWLPVEDDEEATLKLWTKTGVRVLPGSYLGRSVNGINPGKSYIRVAMVAPINELQRGLIRVRDCLYA